MRIEKIGNATLYLADCAEVMPKIGQVDVVITDPPYGNGDTHAGHLSSVTLKGGEARKELGFSGISKEHMVDLAASWVKIARRWVVFTSEWKFLNALDDEGLLIRFGIWRKPDGAPQFTGDRPGTGWEAIAICHRNGKKRWNGGGKHAFYTYAKGTNKTGHPTGKPIGLFMEFVHDFTEVGEIVFDPFMGSGTTGVASVRMGRSFIGIERDPAYFEIACDRIRNAQLQFDMFSHKEQEKHDQLGLWEVER